MTEKRRLSLEHIERAADIIDPVFLNSPQFRAEPLEKELGCRVVVKVETVNPIRSFKARGTEYLASLLEEHPHLVCATAGNFGQALAFSARKRGLSVTIFASVSANQLKAERMRAFGGDVRLVGENFGAARRAAQAFAADNGALLVEDGRNAPIAEGAGTIGPELFRWPEPFDAILVPLGDGALLAGVARWVKAHHPATQMIGVCARGAPAMERSWRAGQVQEVEQAETIADGIAVQTPFPEAISDLTGLVDDVLLVEDHTLLAAMRRGRRELGLVLEPAGAAGLAALMAYQQRFQRQLIATILTGGNVDPEIWQRCA